jgi:hypothetical protein
MSTMPPPFVVELPAEMKPLLEAEAREHGFTSVADYLKALVGSNAAVEVEDPRLEAALREGLASGEVREADDAFWSDLGRRARQAAKKPRG